MSAIPTPATIEASLPAAQPLLEAVKRQLGVAPNMFRIIGNSPAGLEGYLGLSAALGKGELEAKTRTRIAMLVAELNRCDYCLSAHHYLGKNVAKLADDELALNRDGVSGDPKATAALRFARALVLQRGSVTPAEVAAVKAAGHSDAQLVEIILHVAINTLTNYVNKALATDIDFPVVSHRAG
jgi:uncharacterized peroxidase-related enzyme